MSSSNFSTDVDFGSIFSINFNNPTCVIWAVLALARLNEKLPSDFGSLYAVRLRNALDNAIGAFCDDRMEETWSTLCSDEAWQLLSTLKRTAADYYKNAEGVQTPDMELEYLLEMFAAFYIHVQRQEDRDYTENYGALGMLNAVAIQMSRILGTEIADTFDMFNNISVEGVPRDIIDICVHEQIDFLCAAIEQFVREQLGTNAVYNSASDVRDTVGRSFVRLIHDPLRQYVEIYFKMLINDLAFCSSCTVDKHKSDSKARVAVFYRQVGRFFSYSSPLLSKFFFSDFSDNEYEDEEDEDQDYPEHVPEYVANHDFSQYDDFDWHTREYDLFEVQDVLLGPEHVEMVDISSTVTAADSSCPLCDEADAEVRKLNVCGHEVCSTCLDAQLRVDHECRYRCAICRAEFFPDSNLGSA